MQKRGLKVHGPRTEKASDTLQVSPQPPFNTPIPPRLRPTPQIAFPGGFVDAGEKVSAAIRREFGEEALNTLELEGAERSRVEENLRTLFDSGETIYTGYVNDERNTDNAWVETTAMLFHDNDGAALSEFHLSAGDEVTSVQWTMVS